MLPRARSANMLPCPPSPAARQVVEVHANSFDRSRMVRLEIEASLRA